MSTFMVRKLVDGKIMGHKIEAGTQEEAEKKFGEILPLLIQQQKDAEQESPPPDMMPGAPPIKNHSLDGKTFLSLEFQCSACGTLLSAVFKDGYLQIGPCPTCLGELEKMVEASRRFLERKKGA